MQRLHLALSLPPLSDVGGDARDSEHTPGIVTQWELDGEVGVWPVIVGRDLFTLDGLTGLHHKAIVAAKPVSQFVREDIVVGKTNDPFPREIEQLFKLSVDEQVTECDVFDEDHRRGVLDDLMDQSLQHVIRKTRRACVEHDSAVSVTHPCIE